MVISLELGVSEWCAREASADGRSAVLELELLLLLLPPRNGFAVIELPVGGFLTR